MTHFIKLIYPANYHARFGVHKSRAEKIVEKSLYSNEQLRLFISRGVEIVPMDEPDAQPAAKPKKGRAKKGNSSTQKSSTRKANKEKRK